MRPRLQRWRGATIGKNVWIGVYVYVDDVHPSALTIGVGAWLLYRFRAGVLAPLLERMHAPPRRSLE